MANPMRKAVKPAKVDRRPYKHAADTREALLALHTVLDELSDGPPRFLPGGLGTGEKDVTHFCPSALLIKSWEMTDYAEKLRAAAKRVLVARYGIRSARQFDGWRRGQWIGSPTYRSPLDKLAAAKRRAA